MPINIESLLHSIPNCAWSHSNQYFSDTLTLQNIGFSGLTDTDIFIHTSFSISGKIPLTGAVIQTFTNDNMENENYILYCFPAPNIHSQNAVKVYLQEKKLLSFMTLTNFFAVLPFFSLVLFNLLILILPKLLRNVFFYINITATVFIGLMYAHKGIRFFLHIIRTKKTFIENKKVEYAVPQDSSILRTNHVQALIPLSRQGIDTAVIYKNMVYVKQDIPVKKTLLLEKISSQIMNTISYLFSDSFMSLFV